MQGKVGTTLLLPKSVKAVCVNAKGPLEVLGQLNHYENALIKQTPPHTHTLMKTNT